MSIGQSISYCLNNYTNFNGRGSRSEFWWFFLAAFVTAIVLQGILSVILGDSFLYSILALIVGLAIAIPLYAAGARRMHDTGKSGWLQLLVLIPCVGIFIMLFLWAQQGQPGDNQYGPPPVV